MGCISDHVIMPDPRALSDQMNRARFVLFRANRREGDSHSINAMTASLVPLVASSENVLAYMYVLLPDQTNYVNLVLCKDTDQMVNPLGCTKEHIEAVKKSPNWYKDIRIHSGVVENLDVLKQTAGTAIIQKTRYIKYGDGKVLFDYSRNLDYPLPFYHKGDVKAQEREFKRAKPPPQLKVGYFLAGNCKELYADALKELSNITKIQFEFVDSTEPFDLAFMCGLKYAREYADKAVPLGAPLERFGGTRAPVYFSDVVVHAASNISTFKEARTVAVNEVESYSGWEVLRLCVGDDALKEKDIWFSGAHQVSLSVVASGQCDCAVVDSQVLQSAIERDPTLPVKRIARIGPSPAPPLIGMRDSHATAQQLVHISHALMTMDWATMPPRIYAAMRDSVPERAQEWWSAKPKWFGRSHPPKLYGGGEFLEEEVEFDASVHLQLEMPKEIVSMAELGYSKEDIDARPSPMAVTGAFRMLSDEGLRVFQQKILPRLEAYAQSSVRIPRVLRGAAWRSKWLRDCVNSPELVAFASKLAKTELIPHPMEIMHAHINLTPLSSDTIKKVNIKPVDTW